MDEASLRLRMAARTIFETCFLGDDFERSEAERFPRHSMAVAAAEGVLETRASGLPERRYLSTADLAFEVRYALGRAPASLYVDARSKERGKREHALERLVELITARLAMVEMSYPLRAGWRNPPFEGVQVAPGQSE